ncbi:Receptor-type tyrosine-protein phosphatase C [Frankliniella fusca]|uniref:Receptor-type tyrosine-protein phosphatase C n=1 Tax=Frankliniella fusca TaxID=407009 RepID=A0AAE1HN60_9NEOP|nr:Receptor-type tyrosine-protein phosphatase C [Frankliniella fusca]
MIHVNLGLGDGLQADDAPLHFPSGPTLEQLQQQRNPAAANSTVPKASTALNSTTLAANATVSTASSALNSTTLAANATASTPLNSTILAANSTAPAPAVNGSTTLTAAVTSNVTETVTKATASPATPAATLQPFLQPTKSAGVLVGVFVTLALLGYLGLMVWRRVLERRYGNREILVNEEQFEQERDLGNFQL